MTLKSLWMEIIMYMTHIFSSFVFYRKKKKNVFTYCVNFERKGGPSVFLSTIAVKGFIKGLSHKDYNVNGVVNVLQFLVLNS